uniref:Uncharacterized protein n=1 Tax=Streptomyces somaliensis TaxID=78355 RepID=A0A140GIG1_9ACTN|nr:hypothetical protein [Streptomyces somaliensis]
MSTLLFPLRAQHVGTDPVHAARSIRAGGMNTACLMWLDSAAPHKWLSPDAPVTCTKCQRATEK